MPPRNTTPTRETLREQASKIIKEYSKDVLVAPKAFGDGGLEPLWGRFERALLNQVENGEVTVSRYAIWANTVRDNILEGMELANKGDLEKANHHFVRAANSLAAFSEAQSLFDLLDIGKD